MDQRDWLYLKLYLGRAVDRVDRLVIELDRVISQRPDVQGWFFIRYVDEQGIHLRLRVLPAAGARDALREHLVHACATRLSRAYELPAGTYFPMVATPGFEDTLALVTDAHNDVRVIEADYEPETDKYGTGTAMAVAEDLFVASTEIACAILNDEDEGLYARKSLVPALMHETYRAFLPRTDAATFWREYCFYWLGGKSLAAGDWRDTFFAKAAQLDEEGVPVLALEQEDGRPARFQVTRWQQALAHAAQQYAALGSEGGDLNPEVLCFNFAHLMNNRLGIASLEEAYMAALIERTVEHVAA